jgi:hypothetical protein
MNGCLWGQWHKMTNKQKSEVKKFMTEIEDKQYGVYIPELLLKFLLETLSVWAHREGEKCQSGILPCMNCKADVLIREINALRKSL